MIPIPARVRKISFDNITTIYGENERDRLRETLAFLTAFSRAGLGEGERLLL